MSEHRAHTRQMMRAELMMPLYLRSAGGSVACVCMRVCEAER